jgi:hypothetical protein
MCEKSSFSVSSLAFGVTFYLENFLLFYSNSLFILHFDFISKTKSELISV